MDGIQSALGAQPAVGGHLDTLGARPPQSLLLEGGTAADRHALALAWAARLHCGSPSGKLPCLACAPCQAVAAGVSRDFFALDGSQGTVKVDDVRGLKRLMGEPPRQAPFRVIALLEAQGLTTEAANCLLKVMEEPRPGNVFVLTAPLRERLLPTLVSRSMVLTLRRVRRDEGHDELATALAGYWLAGRGWFEASGPRGKVEPLEAQIALASVERALADAYAGRGELARAHPAVLDSAWAAVIEAGRALDLRVSPSLVLDWLATAGREALGRSPKR